jgi:hypothetical protein
MTDPFQAPRASLETPGNVPRHVSERNLFTTWFLIILVGGIGGAIAGAIVGGTIGGVSAAMGIPLERVNGAISVASFLAGVGVGYLAFRYFVKRLISRVMADGPDAL